VRVSAAPPLATAPVQLRDVEQTYTADGTVEAVHQAVVAAQVPGRILELRVEAGQSVRKGQLIARIDDREAAQVLAQSLAQVARAQADHINGRAQYERTRSLFDRQFVSHAALDKAQADLDTSAALLSAAKAVVAQAEAARSHSTVAAPVSGMVITRHADSGDMAQPGKPLVTLYEPGRMRVIANVPQAKVGEIRVSGAATAEIPALKQRIRAASVTIMPEADPQTHTTPVRLDLPAGFAGIYPGMFARAHFAVGISKKLAIPAQAVVYRSEVVGAYVVDEKGGVHFRQLRLGEPAGAGAIEVLAGLVRGERVALDPATAMLQAKSPAK